MNTALKALAALLLFALPAQADEVTAGDIAITQAWARFAPGPNSAAFMVLTNKGSQPDRLIATQTPRAKAAELHSHRMVDGVARMRPVEGGIEIPAGDSVSLQPGGHHVMIMGLSQPLKMGETLPVTLIFEKAGAVELMLPVQKGPGHAH